LSVEVCDDAVSEAVKFAHLARARDPIDLQQDGAKLADDPRKGWIDSARALSTGQLTFHRVHETIAGVAK
jgi:hypothetical protein